jgi:hypothetical protein
MDGQSPVDPAREVVGRPALLRVPIECVEAGLQQALENMRREHDEQHPDGPAAQYGWEEDAMVWRRPDSQAMTFRLREVDEESTELICGGEMMVPFETVSEAAAQMMADMMTRAAGDMATQITRDFGGYEI